jgi:hypothetical protein
LGVGGARSLLLGVNEALANESVTSLMATAAARLFLVVRIVDGVEAMVGWGSRGALMAGEARAPVDGELMRGVRGELDGEPPPSTSQQYNSNFQSEYL